MTTIYICNKVVFHGKMFVGSSHEFQGIISVVTVLRKEIMNSSQQPYTVNCLLSGYLLSNIR